MKKNYLLIALTLLFATGIEAAERSLAQKRQVAAAALGLAGGTRAAVTDLRELKVMGQLTVMGGDRGFAIVANDDRNEALIGVSAGKFDAADVPDGLSWWLEAADEALANSGTGYRREVAPIPDGLPAEVSPMEACTWGQDAPFNDLCPNGYPSGCVATAMSQIMYYYKYPATGAGELYDAYNDTMIDLSNVAYDYDLMKSDYTGGYTKAEGAAVATLMYHCGLASQMSYAYSGSGTHLLLAAKALADKFGYNPNVACRQRDFHSRKDWMDMVYGELAAGRPILYAGSDTRQGGHAFVFEGYNADGFVYVNWGWDGASNGWFDIDLLNATDESSYSIGQNMLTGFALPDVDIPHVSEVEATGAFEVDYYNGSVTALLASSFRTDGKALGIINFNYYDFNGSLNLMLEGNGLEVALTTAGNLQMEMPSKTKSGDGIQYTIYSFSRDMKGSLPADLPDGTYKVYLGVQENGYDDITPMFYPDGKTSSYTLTKSGNSITCTPSEDEASGIGRAPLAEGKDGTTKVYDAEGRMVYSAPADRFSVKDVPADGLLIIKSGGSVKKVVK